MRLLTFVFLMLCFMASCTNDKIVCTSNSPTVGISTSGCINTTQLNTSFNVFRAEQIIGIDLEQDGSIDIDVFIKDENFGIAGSITGQVLLIPRVDNIEIGQIYSERQFCFRYESSAGPNPDPFYILIDYRLCELYNEQELAEVDTVKVEDHSGFVVRAFEQGAEISDQIEWSGDTTVLFDRPYQSGNFNAENSAFILVKKARDEQDHFGWIEIKFTSIYGIEGEIISTGIMR